MLGYDDEAVWRRRRLREEEEVGPRAQLPCKVPTRQGQARPKLRSAHAHLYTPNKRVPKGRHSEMHGNLSLLISWRLRSKRLRWRAPARWGARA